LNPRAEALARAFATPVVGPTYRPFTRALAALLVAGLFAWAAQAAIASAESLSWQQVGASAVVGLALLWPLPSLLWGRTVIDADGIRQLGWMGREAGWVQVQRVRFLAMPMSPRLIVSVGLGRSRVFYSGSAELDAAFRHAVLLLTGPLPDALSDTGRTDRAGRADGPAA
jgi:hypothetical protein